MDPENNFQPDVDLAIYPADKKLLTWPQVLSDELPSEPPETGHPLNLRIRVSAPIPCSQEEYPLSTIPTPYPLRSFEAVVDGTTRKFQEEPVYSVEELCDADSTAHSSKINTRKRQADESASVNSVVVDSVPASHKRLCPAEESSADASQEDASLNLNLTVDPLEEIPDSPSNEPSPLPFLPPAIENILASPSNGPGFVSYPPTTSGLSTEAMDSEWILPSPSLSAISNQAHPDMPPNPGSMSGQAAIENIPDMIYLFETLPVQAQDYFMFQLLRRMPRASLQLVSSLVVPQLKRNFLAKLPYEITQRILEFMDAPSLCSASQVDRTWKELIDNNDCVWERRTKLDSLDLDLTFHTSPMVNKWGLGIHESDNEPSSDSSFSTVTESKKDVYKQRFQTHLNWGRGNFRQVRFQTAGIQVITCLQFDNEKIVMGSEATTISVHHLKSGELYKQLEGHEGGVWTLQFIANTLATGSTDRTVRIWDIKRGVCTHIFTGHSSTVRCLQLVMPIEVVTKGPYGNRVTLEPAQPLVVTGSRDANLRAWRLPSPTQDNPYYNSSSPNPFFKFLLTGHTSSVRTLSAQGKYLASGSYDHSVRVWDLEKGENIWHLTGHTNKVYNVVMDRSRMRCMSGSMDQSIRVWDITNGTCIQTLSVHTSLVGLLQLSNEHLVSAAADASIRVWDPDTLECRHLMKGHQGAIMALHHDSSWVVSGSEGAVKLWNITTGLHVRDLITGVNGVWQIKANNDVCVAAVNRSDATWIEIMDFSHNSNHYTKTSKSDEEISLPAEAGL